MCCDVHEMFYETAKKLLTALLLDVNQQHTHNFTRPCLVRLTIADLIHAGIVQKESRMA